MPSIYRISRTNSLVQAMVMQGRLSLRELKRVYRKKCKETHPDVSEQDSRAFQQLQEEYQEAARLLLEIGDTFSALETKGKNSWQLDIRAAFYSSLQRYTASGMHSHRVRLKPELKVRNTKILEEVFYWGSLYDSEFPAVFRNYNQVYYQRFKEWKKNEQLVKARKIFLMGLRNATDYSRNRTEGSKRTAVSLLQDALYILERTENTPFSGPLAAFARWLLDDVQKNT